MNLNEIGVALEPLLKVLKDLNIPYFICGSLASSTYGIARSTQDIDMVSDLTLNDADKLVELLKKDYFISEEMIADAIKNKSSFNIFHLHTMIKIDVFILKDEPYHKISIERIRKDSIDPENNSIIANISSPEDVILSKLQWYKAGEEISERQWKDILGVIKIQGDNLDNKYLEQWAKFLDVYQLLINAYSDCDLEFDS